MGSYFRGMRELLPKRVESLVHVFLLGRDIDEHQRLAVASQAVLQEMSQFRIPEQISTLISTDANN